MTGEPRPGLARAFRRAALPLSWYYGVTLGLPLVNGAARSGVAFVNHALVVVLVPPVLIVFACAVHRAARTLANASGEATRLLKRLAPQRKLIHFSVDAHEKTDQRPA